jgi:UDP-sugar transporter A1/2/3
MPLVNGQRFLASTAIFFAEIIKLAFATTMALYEIATGLQKPETLTIGKLMRAFSRAVFTGDSWKLAIPAALYLVQSSFQYVAATNLDPAVFALTYQLKTVSTAVFGTILVGQGYSIQQWLSLGLLTAGVGIVDLSAVSRAGKSASGKRVHLPRGIDSSRNVWDPSEVITAVASHLSKRSATYEGIHSDFEAADPQPDVVAGLMAAVAACLLSGVASVYFERLLKVKGEYSKSVWVRNVQLIFYGIWPALFICVFFLDGEHIAKAGFLAGYNPTVWTVIFSQAVGGILIASTLMQAGAATKCLAILPSTLLVLLASGYSLSLGVDSWVSLSLTAS